MLLALPNLSSSVVFETNPWDFKPDVPKAVQQNKNAFVSWCQKPTTKNCHFSASEGLDPEQRTGSKNPVIYLRGLVADYDAVCTEEMLLNVVAESPTEFPPNWGSFTFSRGARLVWLFKNPLAVPDNAFVKSFLKLVTKKLKLIKLLPGFDVEAFIDPCRYYDRGSDWRPLCSDIIPENLLHLWLYETGNRRKWDKKGVSSIPMEDVAAEVAKQYPGAWRGDTFEDGSRGNRFWDSSASNKTAAVIRSSGVQCFTGDSAFLTWEQLLGKQFVAEYQASIVGEIIADYFYDGRVYWTKDDVSGWKLLNKEDTKLALKVHYKLNSVTPKGETSSEVDQALFNIQNTKRVRGALPFVHRCSGLLTYDNERYLNISQACCLEPAKRGSYAWGENFPWLADFLSNLFVDDISFHSFLSWWKQFYGLGLEQKPQSGLALFLAGDSNAGKTLLSTGIISKSVGGHSDASAFLLGETKFTSHILDKPIMSIDDTLVSSNESNHTKYSANLKKVVANPHLVYEKKYENGGMVEWLGRIIVTCNLDSESLRVLPNLDISIQDKIMMLRCANSQTNFPSYHEIQKILGRELPYLCRWLLKWEIPEECKSSEARFGINPYHDPMLVAAAVQSSRSFSFLELLVDFLDSYRESLDEETQKYWTGTVTQLISQMGSDERLTSLVQSYTPNSAASLLGQLKSRGFDIDRIRSSKQRAWRIPLDLKAEISTTLTGD